ncbi:hypothetical protein Tco_0374978 [Tanacetum coccineum]
MAAVEVPQTLKYKGGQLNAAPVLEVENFTNWKKRYKALMNELVNDGIKLSKLEINTGFINGLLICEKSHIFCTDNTKITRKRSKPDKHRHGNGKSAQEPEESSKRFEYQVMSWQNKTYPRPLIGQDSKRNDTLASYKHTREEKFALKPLEKRHNYSGIRIATLAIRVLT